MRGVNLFHTMETVIILLLITAIFGFFFRKDIKEKFRPDQKKNYTIDDRYNDEKVSREKEIDQLLSKMGKNGVDDLSEKDRKKLDKLSKH